MGLSGEQLQTAGELVSAAASVREAAAALRGRFPDLRAIVVDDMDMRDETPALCLGARKVFLAATDGHCWRVTQSADDASALILTQA